MNETKNHGRIDDEARVNRGGSWSNLPSFYGRVTYRCRDSPYYQYGNLGFRIVVSAPTNHEKQSTTTDLRDGILRL